VSLITIFEPDFLLNLLTKFLAHEIVLSAILFCNFVFSGAKKPSLLVKAKAVFPVNEMMKAKKIAKNKDFLNIIKAVSLLT
jgi:hypothetical protein